MGIREILERLQEEHDLRTTNHIKGGMVGVRGAPLATSVICYQLLDGGPVAREKCFRSGPGGGPISRMCNLR